MLSTHLLRERKYRIGFIIGFVVFLNLHRIILMYTLDIPLLPAAVESFVHNFLLGLTAIVIMRMQAYYRPVKNKVLYVVGTTTALSGIWLMFVTCALQAILANETAYLQWVSDTLAVRWAFGWSILTGAGLVSFFMYEMQEQQEQIARREAAEKLAREAELFKLRQQLQPHFLFNSLNSINALVSLRPEEARQMIQKLSDFLRGTLKKEDQSSISLKEELQYLQLYLDIEQVRFRHRLTTQVEQGEGTETMQIPPMLLQPVVENAIKFGLYDTTEAITIRVRAWHDNGLLMISVSNPYDPALQLNGGTGFGLSSIQRRLYLLFARADLLETHADERLFTTIIKVPQIHDKDDTHR